MQRRTRGRHYRKPSATTRRVHRRRGFSKRYNRAKHTRYKKRRRRKTRRGRQRRGGAGASIGSGDECMYEPGALGTDLTLSPDGSFDFSQNPANPSDMKHNCNVFRYQDGEQWYMYRNPGKEGDFGGLRCSKRSRWKKKPKVCPDQDAARMAEEGYAEEQAALQKSEAEEQAALQKSEAEARRARHTAIMEERRHKEDERRAAAAAAAESMVEVRRFRKAAAAAAPEVDVSALAKDESKLQDQWQTEMMSAPMGRADPDSITVENMGTPDLQALKRDHPELYDQLHSLDRSALEGLSLSTGTAIGAQYK